MASSSNPTITKDKRSSIYKKFQPNLLTPNPPLPTINDFRLENILAHDLKEESQAVVDSLLRVTSNYQNDLRKGIKYKLSIEQKIQYKNIEIAKLAHSLNKSILHKNKKLRKAFTTNNGFSSSGDHSMEYEISQLLNSSVKASAMIKSLANRLSKIDQLVNKNEVILSNPNSTQRDEYPYLFKYLTPSNDKLKRDENSNNETAITDRTVSSGNRTTGNSPIIKNIKESSIVENTSIHVAVLKNEEAAESSVKQELIMNNNTIKYKSHQTNPIVDDDMNPEQFELFMSSTISKYRQLQDKKYGHDNIFMDLQESNIGISEKDTFHHSGSTLSHQSDSTLNSHKSNNPIKLLSVSNLHNSNYSEHILVNESPLLPFSIGLNVKSQATVKSTHLTSHFKKLRINGSPITSATFEKMKDKPSCECGNSHDRGSLDSPARRSLSDSLAAIDNLRLSSDDDAWNSSELNTETEEDIESDPILTSESSDTDSSNTDSDTNYVAYGVNRYYTLFKSELRLKKKKLKENILRQKRRHKRKYYTRKEMSPTPKHKPSHHILKPKRSILKIPNSASKLVQTPPAKKSSSDTISDLEGTSPIWSKKTELSPMNVASDPKLQITSLCDLTATGTILSTSSNLQEDSEDSIFEYDDNEIVPWNGHCSEPLNDNEDLNSKSISNLRNLLL